MYQSRKKLTWYPKNINFRTREKASHSSYMPFVRTRVPVWFATTTREKNQYKMIMIWHGAEIRNYII